MKTLIALSIALLLQDPPAESPVTVANLEAALKECAPLVEKQTGKKFPKLPAIVISTPEQVAEIIAREFVPQCKILLPSADAEESSKMMGKVVAAGMLAKYEFAANKLHFIPGNFGKMAERAKNPRMLTAGFARMVLIHEAVHSLDEQIYGISARLAKAATSDEIEVWNGMLEGHAQYVTSLVAATADEKQLFADLESFLLIPPGTGEGEKFFNSILGQATKFAYGDGRLFFEGLAKSGKPTFVDDAFAAPPKKPADMLHPETFYTGSAARPAKTDLKPILGELEKEYMREGWRGNSVKLDERGFRAGCGDYVEKPAVDAALKGFVGGDVFVTATATGSAMIIFAVLESESDEMGVKLYDLDLALCKAKDKRMTEGTIRITAADYTPQASEKAAAMMLVAKTLKVNGEEVKVNVGIARVGRFTVEITFSNEPIEKAKLIEQAEKLCEKLKALK